ncbi:hypothetical protein F9L00_25080, partial [Brucella anthropi]|uniref:hypothetical protein n=1 Tax=Brucella anthropi TaxID=529 RepID=UPI00124F08D8
IDLSQFPELPPEVVKAFADMQFELSVERAARQHEQAVVAEKDGERDEQPTAFGVDGIAIALSFRTSVLPASA